jgi:ribosomal protein S18 acetylase RimI-like enzyme
MAPDPCVLDNAVWHALHGAHAHLAVRHGRAVRYHPEVSVFGAVDRFDDASWADLAALDDPAPTPVVFRPDVPEPPADWEIAFGGDGRQMVLHTLRPAAVPAARPLTTVDVPEMLALVARTRPGPFGPRTIELGAYHGVFEGGRLVAMAGERLRPTHHTEISAVCTAPEARGRGLAAGLTTLVARGILARGDVPFLHHAADNLPAQRVYERLGFRFRRDVRFVSFRRVHHDAARRR